MASDRVERESFCGTVWAVNAFSYGAGYREAEGVKRLHPFRKSVGDALGSAGD
jgi:hypothetical protein